jgi:disulfide oxidoreductase YuzD
MLGNVYDYVTKFLKRKYPWQVASSFVTNILDINQQSMEEGTKVKVLKPAEDFY